MRVLHVTAELYPWVKSGGLGDVAAALPPALIAEGVDARVLVPGFAAFLDNFTAITDVARLATPFAAERVRVALGTLPGTTRRAYLVDHPAFYDRPGGPYAGPNGIDWPDNHRRFALFGWVAAALARGADPHWRPDILHIHDWHGGLAPAYLVAAPPPFGRVATVFTVHNIAYQGTFPAQTFAELALPAPFYAMEGVEFYGQVSFLKAGLFYADRLTTVSPTYAREIQTAAFGYALDGLLRRRANVLGGILNGVDPAVWDPAHDPALPVPYDADQIETGKPAAKAALQRRLGLDERPDRLLFGAVSRLAWQKGLDLLLEDVPALVGDGAQLALLGTGEPELERGFATAAAVAPRRVGVVIGYDEALAHLIIAGSDVLVVPSRFEPCGLTQLYALRYGTLPLVRKVGGLVDTVTDATAVTLVEDSATGFTFDAEDAPVLLAALRRAAALFREPGVWRQVMRRAMRCDFSWAAAARQYVALYRDLVPATLSGGGALL